MRRFRSYGSVEILIGMTKNGKACIKIRLLMSGTRDTSFLYPDFNDFRFAISEILESAGKFKSRSMYVEGRYRKGKKNLSISFKSGESNQDLFSFELDQKEVWVSKSWLLNEIKKKLDEINSECNIIRGERKKNAIA